MDIDLRNGLVVIATLIVLAIVIPISYVIVSAYFSVMPSPSSHANILSFLVSTDNTIFPLLPVALLVIVAVAVIAMIFVRSEDESNMY